MPLATMKRMAMHSMGGSENPWNASLTSKMPSGMKKDKDSHQHHEGGSNLYSQENEHQ